VKAKLGSDSAQRPGKVPKRTEAGKKQVRDVALSKPQLVQALQVSQPTSRPASR